MSAVPWNWVGRIAGPMLGIAIYVLLGGDAAGDLGEPGRRTAAVGALMAVFWMTEALPLPATSLLPLVLFPAFEILPISDTAAPYANRFIFLFLGGFLIAAAIERWGLHRRWALATVLAVGTGPRRLVGGFMLATAALSLWISNTATTVMMVPIALSVTHLLRDRENQAEMAARFETCLLLAIAYAASIGGLGTLIGTPPNAFLAGFLEEQGQPLGFARWMAFALPFAIVFLVAAWWILTTLVFPLGGMAELGDAKLLRAEYRALGRMRRTEVGVVIVFVATALAWVFREPLTVAVPVVGPALGRLGDPGIAMAGALALFFIPADPKRGRFLLEWEDAKELPWGALLLFGGGLSLAAAVGKTGLDAWFGTHFGAFAALPSWLLILAVAVLVILLTELTSNLATTTALAPILHGVAEAAGIDPLLLLVPLALAASCAFMLPVATPPNAIVYGAGRVPIGAMVRAGLCLNIVAILLIVVAIQAYGLRVLGVETGGPTP